MDGWIKLHRQIIENDLYFAEPFTRMQAWIDLLLIANHKESFFYIRGNKIVVGRGQIGMGAESLAKRWKWSRGKVERFLKQLENDHQIEQQKSFITTIISVCNYEEYQQNGQQTEQQTGSRRAADGQQTDIYNNEKNDNNENKEYVFVEPTKKITPQTVEEKNYIEVEATKKETEQGKGGAGKKFVQPTIEEVESYIKEKGYNVDAERFVAYYESNGWKVGKNPMKDWKMAIVTWSKNDNQQKNNYKTFEKQPYRHPAATIFSDELTRKQIEKAEANKQAAILRAQNRQVDT
jgi:hypothetical protein